ncbi:peroxiredoxin [Mizugakiibacter sediminis]|uniref:Peroxiredoxin n=1 Tax=Mizugakiibacter sediminis TaxID=1475481 RepID=A0A0K8QK95_9GAMM|nr:redoxin domain-containing protein [Mizugakiibacter sediminis]GAP65116.1 peroxiredoxin [Mizugakiibacter sediminis]
MAALQAAPEWQVARWFNGAPPTLAGLRGRVVLLHAFQMLCPGCAMHALPQMQRVHRAFPRERLAVIGLHTVFEHHAAQGPAALAAFLHEYRYEFPVGVDAHDAGDPLPRTMRAYAMQGTPTLVLIDAAGRLRRQHFGVLDDLALGAALGGLLAAASADA